MPVGVRPEGGGSGILRAPMAGFGNGRQYVVLKMAIGAVLKRAAGF